MTDTVTSGAGTGQSLQFTITMTQTGSKITGSGGSLSFTGTRTGNSIDVGFTRPGGSGSFHWTVQADGSLIGTFTDDGAANGGTSTGSLQGD